MKKIILTAIVILTCVVNAQTWTSGNGRLNSSEEVGVVYHAQKGNVQFDYSWGEAHTNQMWTYERTDTNTGWKYEGGTFEFTSDYVWTDFNTQLDERKGNPGTIVEYGYYTIGADGKANDPVALFTKDAAGQTIENSVVFQKGEKIGIFGGKKTNLPRTVRRRITRIKTAKVDILRLLAKRTGLKTRSIF